MEKLSPHFSLAEATLSETAIRREIPNIPDAEQLANMRVAALGMEQVRSILDRPVTINSWFRCLRLNRAIGSSDHSAHTRGFAIDFTCSAFGNPRKVCEAILEEGLRFDQMILEGVSKDNPHGAWVHLSFDPKMRNQILTMRMIHGKAAYTQGLS